MCGANSKVPGVTILYFYSIYNVFLQLFCDIRAKEEEGGGEGHINGYTYI